MQFHRNKEGEILSSKECGASKETGVEEAVMVLLIVIIIIRLVSTICKLCFHFFSPVFPFEEEQERYSV